MVYWMLVFVEKCQDVGSSAVQCNRGNATFMMMVMMIMMMMLMMTNN